MNVNILTNEGLVLPSRGSDKSSGYDIIAISKPEIVGKKAGDLGWESIDYIQYKTGLKIQPQPTFVPSLFSPAKQHYTLIYPRSSISKYNLILANSVGVADIDYIGELLLRFKYISQPKDMFICDSKFGTRIDQEKIYQRGDRIGQLIFTELVEANFAIVESLNNTTRSTGGFGSTGK